MNYSDQDVAYRTVKPRRDDLADEKFKVFTGHLHQ